FDPGSLEVGNEIVLAGSHRYPSAFAFEFWGTNDIYGQFEGNVQARIRFYQNDGPLSPSGYSPPGTVLFDSGPFAITAVPRATVLFDNFMTGALVPLAHPLPDSFTWTVQFSGLSGADRAGVDLFSPPVVGNTYQDYWELDPDGWRQKLDPSGPINFAAR